MELWFIIAVFFLGLLVRYFFSGFLVYRDYLNKYLIYFGLPLLVFISFLNSGNVGWLQFGLMFVIIMLLVSFIMYFLVNRFSIPAIDKASLFLCSSFGNTAYLGIPLSYLLWGDYGTLIASTFTIIVLITHFTIGLFLAHKYVHKERSFKRILRNPLLWLLFLAIILSQFDLNVPDWLGLIAHGGTFLAIFVIGSSLQLSSITSRTFSLALLKLAVVPLIALPVILLFGFDNPWSFIFLMTLPAGFINNSLALEFKFNDRLASSLITVGTLFFMFVFTVISIFYY